MSGGWDIVGPILRDHLLTDRLRDVNEPNALIVRRQAAERLELYEATIADLTERVDAYARLIDTLVPSAEQRVTHGRHCICSACKQEDWTRISGPCGMHGKDCPAVYAPLGAAGDLLISGREAASVLSRVGGGQTDDPVKEGTL